MAVHEVFVDPQIHQPFGGELVGTFSGQVPPQGAVLNKKLLREPSTSVFKDFPRYHEARYVISRVEWTLTDEAAELKASVFVELTEGKKV